MPGPLWRWSLPAVLMVLAVSWGGAAAAEDRLDAARRAFEGGNLDAAETLVKQSIAEIRDKRPPAEVAEAYGLLADVYLRQDRLAEANLLLEHSLLQQALAPGVESKTLDAVYARLGRVRILQKNIPEAESLLKRALAMRETRLGPDHPEVADVLDGLAEVNIEQEDKDFDAAMALRKRALAIREKAPGLTPAQRIKALSEAADWFAAHYLPAVDAEAIRRRLLPLQEKTLGPMHQDVADTLVKIVERHAYVRLNSGESLSVELDKPAEGRRLESMLVQALAIREKVFGPDHPETIKVAEYLAAGYAGRGDWGRATPLYRRVLTAREKMLGPDHPDLENPRVALAKQAMREHRYRDAIPLLKQQLAFQAAGKKASSTDGLSRVRFFTGRDEDESDDSEDFADQLGKATRLAALEEAPEARPTEADLAFLKAKGWCPEVADVAGLMEVEKVEFHFERLDEADLAHLRGLVNLKKLSIHPKFLGAAERNVGDAGLEHLANLTDLRNLDLTGTAIQGVGLSSLKRMTELRALSLEFTKLDDAGLASLPSLPALEDLELTGTKVTDASIPLLKKLTGLKQLGVSHTKISAQGVAELRQALPSTVVRGPGKVILPGPK